MLSHDPRIRVPVLGVQGKARSRFDDSGLLLKTEYQKNPDMVPGMYDHPSHHAFFNVATNTPQPPTKPSAVIFQCEKNMVYDAAYAWTRSGYEYKIKQDGTRPGPWAMTGIDTPQHKDFWGSTLASLTFITPTARFKGDPNP